MEQINVVNIAATSISTALLTAKFGANGVAAATAIMTIIILIFGEITPKSIAANNSEKVALLVSKPIKLIITILSPVVWIFNIFTKFMFRIIGVKADEKNAFITEEELKTMVNVSHEEGVLEVEEREIINNVFEFGDMQAKDAMVQRMDMVTVEVDDTYEEIIEVFREEKLSRLPVYEDSVDDIIGIINAMVQRMDMVTVEVDDTYEEIIEVFREEKLSRLPVYEDSVDDIIGIINIKDMIFLSDEEKEYFSVKNYMRDPFFTYEFKKITQLLEDMKKAKTQIAIVLDEYGGTSGLLTVEDLVEVIVGDIEDEYDEDEDDIIVIKEDEYIVDGSTRISEVNELIGTSIETEEFDSIGGYLIGYLDRLPEEKEVIEIGNIKFCIEKVEKNRIAKIHMYT